MASPAGRVQLGWWLTCPRCGEGWEEVNRSRSHSVVVLRCVTCYHQWSVEVITRTVPVDPDPPRQHRHLTPAEVDRRVAQAEAAVASGETLAGACRRLDLDTNRVHEHRRRTA